MSKYCVVVAEGSKARIFTLQAAELPQVQSGPRLVEVATPLRARPRDAAPARSGRTRGTRGGFHPFGGHQPPHREDVRKFARDVADQIRRMLRSSGAAHLVLCAEKRMLGLLRPNLEEAIGGLKRLHLHEIPKDLGKLSPHELHRKLARDGYLPRRRDQPIGT